MERELIQGDMCSGKMTALHAAWRFRTGISARHPSDCWMSLPSAQPTASWSSAAAPGSFSRRVLTRLGPGGVLVGVDTTPGLLDQAKAALTGKGTGRFEPTSADITSLGSWLDGADVVLGRAVLHHVPMAELFIGRLRARLRPSTRIGFIEPDFRSPLGASRTWRPPAAQNWLPCASGER